MECSTPGFPVHHQTLWACSNSRPSRRWCHPTISSSAAPFSFSFCLQSFPASECFPVSWLFTSGGQSIGASASATVLPMNIQNWFPLGLTGWISLQSKDSQESSPAPQLKSINFSMGSAFLMVQVSHLYMTTGKTIALIIQSFVNKVMSRFVIAFLPRNKHLLFFIFIFFLFIPSEFPSIVE